MGPSTHTHGVPTRQLPSQSTFIECTAHGQSEQEQSSVMGHHHVSVGVEPPPSGLVDNSMDEQCAKYAQVSPYERNCR